VPKVPADIRSLARGYTDVVIRILGGIAKDGTNESARVTACQVLLDRGWGKPGQPVTGTDGEGDIRVTIRNIVEERKNS
jgi:hypothetical protein